MAANHLNNCAGRQVSNVLRDLANSTGNMLRLDPAVWQSMLAVVDTDDNGQVEWDELVQFMCDVFKHIEREKVVSSAMKQSSTGDGSGAVETSTVVPVEAAGSGISPGPAMSVDDLKAQEDATFGVARTSLSEQRNMDLTHDAGQAAQIDSAPDTPGVAASDGGKSGDVETAG